MILPVAAESRSCRKAVASRAWTRRPRPRAGSYEEDGEDQGTGTPNHIRSAHGPRAIIGPLTRGTMGQPRILGPVILALAQLP